ncbi:VirK/YbjX family protein [Janthinobacterium sp. LB3P112]|uniref:VirK/YbjX family protein n=1 Tax=Janthinobacterium sp. LB3P112 TaxID=3424196 RepID=UPI003F1F2248
MKDIALPLRHGATLPPAVPPPSASGHRLKAALGALFFPRQRTRWQAFLGSMPGLHCLAQLHPCLHFKIYRPYASRQLGCADRLALLEGHYRFLWQLGARALVEQAARQPVVLAAFEGKDGARYRLQLTAIHDSHREGELCLRLTRDGQAFYLASFLFLPRADGVSLQLGALQGLRSEAGAQAVKAATRALHGCRPKNLMVTALRDFGDFFACNNVFLISNDNRIALNARRRRHIAADYDLAWQELHALRMRDGNYHLPCAPYRAPDLADVPSKKRADARRRGQLLQSMSNDMRAQLAGLLEAPAASNLSVLQW